jgi:hypothetical protein
MALHTGEPTVGAEGYVGLDVVRAARICSAGRGGQILMSEATRALIGNELPEDVHVVDLGRQQLKGLHEERLFLLRVNGQVERPPELKAAGAQRRSHAEALADEFGKRIERFMDRQFERALSGSDAPPPPPPQRSTAPQILAVIILGVIALIVVIKYVFF